MHRWKTFLLGVLAGVYLSFGCALSYAIGGELPLVRAYSQQPRENFLFSSLPAMQSKGSKCEALSISGCPPSSKAGTKVKIAQLQRLASGIAGQEVKA